MLLWIPQILLIIQEQQAVQLAQPPIQVTQVIQALQPIQVIQAIQAIRPLQAIQPPQVTQQLQAIQTQATQTQVIQAILEWMMRCLK